jgi:hypothetical protein
MQCRIVLSYSVFINSNFQEKHKMLWPKLIRLLYMATIIKILVLF